VLAELMNEDGHRDARAAVAALLKSIGLKRINDRRPHRLPASARQKLVKRIGEFPVESEIVRCRARLCDAVRRHPSHGFRVWRIGDGQGVLARLHRADVIRDVFVAQSGACPAQALQERGRGVLIFLRDGAAGVPTHASRRSAQLGRSALAQWREVGSAPRS